MWKTFYSKTKPQIQKPNTLHPTNLSSCINVWSRYLKNTFNMWTYMNIYAANLKLFSTKREPVDKYIKREREITVSSRGFELLKSRETWRGDSSRRSVNNNIVISCLKLRLLTPKTSSTVSWEDSFSGLIKDHPILGSIPKKDSLQLWACKSAWNCHCSVPTLNTKLLWIFVTRLLILFITSTNS